MKISLALGFFDSVHIGHRQLLKKNKDFATSLGITAAAHTFSNDLGNFFGSKQLYSFSQRQTLLYGSGVDLIIADEFDENLKNTVGKDFLDRITDSYEVEAFFCGYDYRFGKNAECNVEYLREYAYKKNIRCEILPPQTMDGRKISTTWIKELLSAGDVQAANKLLAKPYFISGKVVRGKGVGAKNGFPTANLSYDGFLPMQGVYKTFVIIEGKQHVAVTNVGVKPTFMDQSVTIEPMIVDFCGDLYGKELTLEFVKFIRPIKKFSSAQELNEQIKNDVKEALCYE